MPAPGSTYTGPQPVFQPSRMPAFLRDLLEPEPVGPVAAEIRSLRHEIAELREELQPPRPSLLLTGQAAMDEYRKLLERA